MARDDAQEIHPTDYNTAKLLIAWEMTKLSYFHAERSDEGSDYIREEYEKNLKAVNAAITAAQKA